MVFVFPLLVIAGREWLGVVDFYAESNGRGAAVSPREFGVGLAAAGENEHHRPVAVTKHALERLDIDMAGVGRFAGMCVDPDPAALLRAATEIYLLLEVLRDRHIIEGDVGLCAALPDQLDLFHQQQIIRASDPERPDFRGAQVTQEQQLRPRGRRKPQLRSSQWSALLRSLFRVEHRQFPPQIRNRNYNAPH